MFIPSVYGAGIDITELPEKLGGLLGVSTFIGGLISGMAWMIPVMLCGLLLSRGRETQKWIVLVFGVVTLSVNVALEWFPYWIMLVIVLLVATLWSSKIKGWIG